MYLEDEKIERYKAMSKPYKSEIKAVFQQEFGYSSGTKFDSLIHRATVATPMQYEFIKHIVEKYALFSQGIVQE